MLRLTDAQAQKVGLVYACSQGGSSCYWTLVLRPGLTKTFFYLPFFGPPYDPRNMLCAVLILSIMVLPVIVAVSLLPEPRRAELEPASGMQLREA